MSLLFTMDKAKKKATPKQQPKPAAAKADGVVKQGECANINTIGLPKGGSESLVWVDCGITLTFYESFESKEVEAILLAYPTLFIPGGLPAKPANSGALVTMQNGFPQSLFPYAKGLVFALQNEAISGGSYYNMTCPKPNSSFRAQPLSLKSHDITVSVPGDIYGGPATVCGLGGPTTASTPKP